MTGAELGAARLALGATQAELGLLVGVHGVTICRWERSGRPVPAWVAGVVQAVLEGQTRQGGHLPRLADALREGGAVPCLALWGTAGIMAPRDWWVWVRRSTLAALLRASDPPPCSECRLVGGAHKLACTHGACEGALADTLMNFGDRAGSEQQGDGKLVMVEDVCNTPSDQAYRSPDNISYGGKQLEALKAYIGCSGGATPGAWTGYFKKKPQYVDPYGLKGCKRGDTNGGNICNATVFGESDLWKTFAGTHLSIDSSAVGNADVDYGTGAPFNDLLATTAAPREISVRGGERINAVSVTYVDGTRKAHGGTGGGAQTLGGLEKDPVVTGCGAEPRFGSGYAGLGDTALISSYCFDDPELPATTNQVEGKTKQQARRALGYGSTTHSLVHNLRDEFLLAYQQVTAGHLDLLAEPYRQARDKLKDQEKPVRPRRSFVRRLGFHLNEIFSRWMALF